MTNIGTPAPSTLEVVKNLFWHISGLLFPLALLAAGVYFCQQIYLQDTKLMIPALAIGAGLPAIVFLGYHKMIQVEMIGTLLGTILGFAFGKTM